MDIICFLHEIHNIQNELTILITFWYNLVVTLFPRAQSKSSKVPALAAVLQQWHWLPSPESCLTSLADLDLLQLIIGSLRTLLHPLSFLSLTGRCTELSTGPKDIRMSLK